MTLNGAAVALGALAGMAAATGQAETPTVGKAEGSAAAATSSSGSGSCVGNASHSASYCADWKDGSTCIAKGCTWEQPAGG
jgi:hypothetical protein